MLYLPNYAGALRCIGQALHHQNIEVFELRSQASGFRVQAGDPNPPYVGLIDVSFSTEMIKMLEREAQAKRGQSNGAVRFDSLSEVLRAVGEYFDNKRGHLRRINNSASSTSDCPVLEVEYETRAGEVQSEALAMSFIRQSSVHMYKKRARITKPISIFAGRQC